MSSGRRRFLAQLASTGVALASGSFLARLGYAQTRGPARVVVDQTRYRAQLDRRLLGAFLEHLGRGGRRIISPQRLDQTFARVDLVRLEQEDGQQRALSAPGQGDAAARIGERELGLNLDRH